MVRCRCRLGRHGDIADYVMTEKGVGSLYMTIIGDTVLTLCSSSIMVALCFTLNPS